jgi:High potential iron-sulfur protein
MNNRRRFLIQTSVAGATGLAIVAQRSFAQSTPINEKDAQASALGYKADATKVDKVKHPKYAAGQNCKSCQLYQGSDKTGVCPLFAGKTVPAAAWCTAWVKKAA